MQIFIKVIITALVVVGISELGKKFTPFAALLASLPLTSILAMVWLYTDTKDIQKISALSTSIFWAVLPSLLFFIILPLLLKQGMKFGWAMAVSTGVMFLAYTLYVLVLQKFGIKI